MLSEVGSFAVANLVLLAFQRRKFRPAIRGLFFSRARSHGSLNASVVEIFLSLKMSFLFYPQDLPAPADGALGSSSTFQATPCRSSLS